MLLKENRALMISISAVFTIRALYIYGKEYIENPVSEAPAAWIEISWPEALDIDDHDDLLVAQCLAAFDGHPVLLRQNQQDQPTPVEEVSAG